MKQKIVLLGGYYGSGKSTLIENLIRHRGGGLNLDYDNIAKQVGAFDPQIMSQNPNIRKEIWDTHLPRAIDLAIKSGEHLIATGATFALRDRRDNILNVVEQYKDQADIYPLFLMLPMRETVNRIKSNRVGNVHPINNVTVNSYYKGTNRLFKYEDHSDLLLPSNRNEIPLEYKSMLSVDDTNKFTLEHPEYDGADSRSWVVISKDINHMVLDKIVDSSPHPLEIRRCIENDINLLEGNSMPIYSRK